MPDNARSETDKKLADMEKHLAEIYNRATKETGEKWKKYMENAEKRIKPLQDAYDKAKASGDKDAIAEAGKALGVAQRNATIMDKHYREMTNQFAKELSNVNKTAAAYVNDQLPGIYALNYNATAKGINDKVKGVSFELVDANTVKNLATKDDTLLPYKYVDGKKDVRWNTQMVNSEVMQGIIQGESMDKIAKRLNDVVGMKAAGSAIRNARTAVTGAENNGRMSMLHDAKDKGVVMHKIWVATHDSRVREAHEDLNGQEKDIDEPFESMYGEIMYPGDPDADPSNVYNCRCTLKYKVVGFEKKG